MPRPLITTHSVFQIALLLSSLLASGAMQAQQPGVDCVPVQGQGWQGCQPINNGTQQQQRPQGPPIHWVVQWGAIATDDTKGIVGSVTGRATQSQASQEAMVDCQNQGGVACKVELAYYNQCAAMVVGDKHHDVSGGPTIEKAIQRGLQVCTDGGDTNCHVYRTACSLPRPTL